MQVNAGKDRGLGADPCQHVHRGQERADLRRASSPFFGAACMTEDKGTGAETRDASGALLTRYVMIVESPLRNLRGGLQEV